MANRSADPIALERPAPPPAPLSFEAFLAWAMKEDVRAEWVAGEVVVMSPSSVVHQELSGFLYRLLVAFVEARQIGRVFFLEFLMRLPTRPSGRQPDLLFISNAHLDRLRETYLDGPADLVVEIISPDSDARDRGDKFVEYEGGRVPEYWLIDPLRQEARFYQLGPDGRYRAAALEADGTYRPTVLPGFRLRVAWLWQRPLPPLVNILPEAGVC